MGKKSLALLTTAMIALSTATAAAGQAPRRYQFDVRSQDLKFALRSVTREAGLQLFADADDLRGRRSPELHADITVEDALQRLLAGTGLHAEVTGKAVFVRGRAEADVEKEPTETTPADIIVTGSHIRGAANASPTITLSEADFAHSGQASLGDIIRSIPQNFSGGQNPGVGITVPVANGENVGSGSSINLRGIGQDATLTLLNGHRVANGGNRQSVDVSSIPLEAVERIEVVTDGASATYGSDAVAGVANVILKPDYQGVSASARWGAATDGGDSQQQYDLITGHRWRSGGFLVAYEFANQTAIGAKQRSYTREANPGLTLYPAIRRHSVIVNGHQNLTDTIELQLDGSYDWRADKRGYAIMAGEGAPRYKVEYRSPSFSIAPSLKWLALPEWSVVLEGSYGQDRSHYSQLLTVGGTTSPALAGCYCNRMWSIGSEAEGALFALPAGETKLAIGGGIRRDEMHAYQKVISRPQDFDVGQLDRYVFAELSLPVISANQHLPFVNQLTLSVAGRFDDYPGVGQVSTPKLGVIYAPITDLDLKASWGRSFKAPTLFQRYTVQQASLYNAAALGGQGGATALLLTGGRAALRPERATSWTVTTDYHPHSVPGMYLEASYFHIRYTDRVVQPIPLLSAALSNSDYAPLVTINPSAEAQAAALDGLPFFNNSGADYDPTNVVAIVDDRNRNVAAQTIHGVDLSAALDRKLPGDQTITVTGAASYLNSRQQLLPTQSSVALSGTYYNPPHFRARAGVSWASPIWMLSGFANYIGGERDTRYLDAPHVGGMLTLDIAIRYRVPINTGRRRKLELFASAINLTNEKPNQTQSRSVYDPTYDTTNYSPVGRIISGGIRLRL